MNVILHIIKREKWEQARLIGVYRDDTLDSEGFIYCSTPQQVLSVANTLFRAQEGLVLLCIESDKIRAEIRHEGFGGGELYPHIYGTLNIDAVIKALDFKPSKHGKFELPRDIANL